MKIIIRYNMMVIAVLVAIALIGTSSCKSSGAGASGSERAILEAEKPSVDRAFVPELSELYRATRYEDLQTAETAGIENVLKISFYGRKMGVLSPEIAKFSYLATLDVSYNELAEFPAELSELHYLQGFYAKGNRLHEFPEQILLLPLLARIDLSDNQITVLPEAITRMDQLISLNLEKNGLSSFPVQLYELESLSVLNLAGNGLNKVPEGIGNMLSLTKLDLSDNQLSGIPAEITSLTGKLKELSIQGNQIAVEEIKWLEEAMPSTRIRF